MNRDELIAYLEKQATEYRAKENDPRNDIAATEYSRGGRDMAEMILALLGVEGDGAEMQVLPAARQTGPAMVTGTVAGQVLRAIRETVRPEPGDDPVDMPLFNRAWEVATARPEYRRDLHEFADPDYETGLAFFSDGSYIDIKDECEMQRGAAHMARIGRWVDEERGRALLYLGGGVWQPFTRDARGTWPALADGTLAPAPLTIP